MLQNFGGRRDRKSRAIIFDPDSKDMRIAELEKRMGKLEKMVVMIASALHMKIEEDVEWPSKK